MSSERLSSIMQELCETDEPITRVHADAESEIYKVGDRYVQLRWLPSANFAFWSGENGNVDIPGN